MRVPGQSLFDRLPLAFDQLLRRPDDQSQRERRQ
jgi:hypothetical protein